MDKATRSRSFSALHSDSQAQMQQIEKQCCKHYSCFNSKQKNHKFTLSIFALMSWTNIIFVWKLTHTLCYFITTKKYTKSVVANTSQTQLVKAVKGRIRLFPDDGGLFSRLLWLLYSFQSVHQTVKNSTQELKTETWPFMPLNIHVPLLTELHKCDLCRSDLNKTVSSTEGSHCWERNRLIWVVPCRGVRKIVQLSAEKHHQMLLMKVRF